jgi:hypothetical protein
VRAGRFRLSVGTTFDSLVTTTAAAELSRRRCEHCREALADWVCTKCSCLYCQRCELRVHHEMQRSGARREELEESKGDGRPHQEYIAPVNGTSAASR